MTYSTYFASQLEEWAFLKYLEKYFLYVVLYLAVLVVAIMVLFIIPLCMLFFVYLSSLFLLIYRKTHKLQEDYSSNIWNSVRLILANKWDRFARFWHGYELHGTENLPDGPGLIIYYHGAIPIDYMYFLSRFFILKRRLCYSVADDFVFKLPGLKPLMDLMGIMHGTKEECLNALKNGHLVGISPGGVREALFSDQSYKLVWRKRKGFAEVALNAKVGLQDGYMNMYDYQWFLHMVDFQSNFGHILENPFHMIQI
ncbi:transmembrane protein 68-like isoform X2 [Eublepharis macularius]|uniref:Transmembrane protein 68-like isoform X2 n=1 Tax=Eublepharis macularius TaxID=481883 RepID=A0AA97JLK1_EUBMA|nr:transmembrane protein 68-like isoform X2 [Eublepharis macularius]